MRRFLERILVFDKDKPKSVTKREVAATLGLPLDATKEMYQKLVDLKIIEQACNGRWVKKYIIWPWSPNFFLPTEED